MEGFRLAGFHMAGFRLAVPLRRAVFMKGTWVPTRAVSCLVLAPSACGAFFVLVLAPSTWRRRFS